MRASRRFVPFLILVALLAGLPRVLLAAAATPATPDPHIERIVQVGRLWGFVRYLHPYLAYRNIDWDQALVDALPRVRDAKTSEEYADAAQSLLSTLGDPATHVLPRETAKAATAPSDLGKPAEILRKLDGGGVLLDLATIHRLGVEELDPKAAEISKELAEAPAVVVDLRDLGQTSYNAYAFLEEVQGALVSVPSRAPTQRYLLHSGYRPQDGRSSGGYYSGFLTLAADTFSPPAGTSGPPRRVVFLLSPGDFIPTIALALQAAGTGSLVAEGKLAEEAVLQTRVLDLGEGIQAQVRVSELMPLPGWPGFHVDAEVPEGQSDAALSAALAESRRVSVAVAPAASVASLPDAVFRPDLAYQDMLEPALPYRWLAVIRAWNVIHYFYPYLHLLDDWDPVLPEFLTRMETAETGLDYTLTLYEMMTHVADGHTYISGHPSTPKYFGEATLPLEIRWIEGAAVVTRIYHDSARQAGLEIGDAILAVDGEPTEARIERVRKYNPGSTETTVRQRILSRFLTRGAKDSTAVLSVQGVDGKVREVRMVREQLPYTPPDEGEVVRILTGNIGYMDLTRLVVPDVPAAFEKVKFTRGLVFDMRGYPNGTAWSIAPRINTRNARIGAQFRRSQVSAFSAEEADAGFYFSQPLPPLPPGVPKYTHPIVMLIDDRAISQSEHSGLFFEAANGTRFIGTPTAGANGDVTSFTLPGGLIVHFTGHDVRHADGSQLQRKGLIPHVEVSPTRAGLHAGKDEVLERALQDLEQTLAQEAKDKEKATP
jgi:C-terminal processing protease CtpA/Prc